MDESFGNMESEKGVRRRGG
jgi:hypothetical protein